MRTIMVIEALVEVGLCPSLAMARRDVRIGAVRVNGVKVRCESAVQVSAGEVVLLSRGKSFAGLIA